MNNMDKQALFTGIDHIGIKALNMEKSICFYTEVLGFNLLNRMKPGHVELAFLELEGTIVELVEVIDGSQYQDGVVNHLAIRVADIYKAIEHLKAHQVEMASSEPVDLGGGRLNLFFWGPSREKLELFQAL